METVECSSCITIHENTSPMQRETREDEKNDVPVKNIILLTLGERKEDNLFIRTNYERLFDKRRTGVSTIAKGEATISKRHQLFPPLK